MIFKSMRKLFPRALVLITLAMSFVSYYVLAEEKPGCRVGVLDLRKARDLKIHDQPRYDNHYLVVTEDKIPDKVHVLDCEGVWRKIVWNEREAWIEKRDLMAVKKYARPASGKETGVSRGFD